MSTDRYTSRSGETPPQSPKLPADARFKGKEDYRLLADPLPTPQAEALNKLSQGQLLGLLEWLVPRDLEILDSLRSAKYLLTGQIQRLHVPVVKSPSGAIRNAANTMRKLKSYGLVKTFQRRIENKIERLVYLESVMGSPSSPNLSGMPGGSGDGTSKTERQVVQKDELTQAINAMQQEEYDERMYRHARCGILGIGTNLPTKAGEKTSIAATFSCRSSIIVGET